MALDNGAEVSRRTRLMRWGPARFEPRDMLEFIALPRAVSRKLWECRGRFAQRFSADVGVVRTYLFALVTDQLLGSCLRNPSFLEQRDCSVAQ